jgi:hypothetical protein
MKRDLLDHGYAIVFPIVIVVGILSKKYEIAYLGAGGAALVACLFGYVYLSKWKVFNKIMKVTAVLAVLIVMLVSRLGHDRYELYHYSNLIESTSSRDTMVEAVVDWIAADGHPKSIAVVIMSSDNVRKAKMNGQEFLAYVKQQEILEKEELRMEYGGYDPR